VSGHIIKRPRARQDLDEAAAYIQGQSGPQRAIRFLRAADSTLAMLAGMPGMGTRYDPHEPLYAGLRYFPITRHRKYLIFYRPLPDGVEVLRVLHGARDIAGILAEEFEADTDADDDEETDEPEA
jgi:toxin ParE1/3/4